MKDAAEKIRALADRIRQTTRQQAACVVHAWLLSERMEADEPDIRAAYRLLDLLDCHTCVQHVAQVYIKGIMGDFAPVFGMQTIVSDEEALAIAARAATPGLRKKPSGGVL